MEQENFHGSGSGKISHAISSGKKSGMQGRIANASEDEFDEQGAAVLDRLRWRCELDCFDLGDQANATRNMMTLIRTTVDPVRREQVSAPSGINWFRA